MDLDVDIPYFICLHTSPLLGPHLLHHPPLPLPLTLAALYPINGPAQLLQSDPRSASISARSSRRCVAGPGFQLAHPVSERRVSSRWMGVAVGRPLTTYGLKASSSLSPYLSTLLHISPYLSVPLEASSGLCPYLIFVLTNLLSSPLIRSGIPKPSLSSSGGGAPALIV